MDNQKSSSTSTSTFRKRAPEVMIFRPTWAEFANFSKYIEYMESKGAHEAGIAKVIPPQGYTPTTTRYRKFNDIVITDPITQSVVGDNGSYQLTSVLNKHLTVGEFKRIAGGERYKTPAHSDLTDLENIFWNTMSSKVAPIYGADVHGTMMNRENDSWNMNELGTILTQVGIDIKGVTSPYLYFGMWRTIFCWHTEDQDLYSVNFLHLGDAKTWYAIPLEDNALFEEVAAKLFPNSSKKCPTFLRHKAFLISPTVLRENGIRYNKVTQNIGEFIVTFPTGYHAGFNNGFNCAEAVNFAMPRWIEIGNQSRVCRRCKGMLSIDMATFRNLQASLTNELNKTNLEEKLTSQKKSDMKVHTRKYMNESKQNKLDLKRRRNISAEQAAGLDNTVSDPGKCPSIQSKTEDNQESGSPGKKRRNCSSSSHTKTSETKKRFNVSEGETPFPGVNVGLIEPADMDTESDNNTTTQQGRVDMTTFQVSAEEVGLPIFSEQEPKDDSYSNNDAKTIRDCNGKFTHYFTSQNINFKRLEPVETPRRLIKANEDQRKGSMADVVLERKEAFRKFSVYFFHQGSSLHSEPAPATNPD